MTKKSTKNVITVNLTNVHTPEEVIVEFVKAKLAASDNLTKSEINIYNDTIVNETVDELINQMFTDNNAILYADGKLHKLSMKEFIVENDNKLEISKDGVKVKKPNIFKRFWNWITRKNK